MKTITDKLNFSQKQENYSAIKLHNRNRDIGYYFDNLCLYCDNNNIDLDKVSGDDFTVASEIMSDYGTNDISTDSFYFWIS